MSSLNPLISWGKTPWFQSFRQSWFLHMESRGPLGLSYPHPPTTHPKEHLILLSCHGSLYQLFPNDGGRKPILREDKKNVDIKTFCPLTSASPLVRTVRLYYALTRSPQWQKNLFSCRNLVSFFWHQPCNSLKDNIPFSVL